VKNVLSVFEHCRYRFGSGQAAGGQVRLGGIPVDQGRRDGCPSDTHERRIPRRSAASGTRGLLRERRTLAAQLRQRAQKHP